MKKTIKVVIMTLSVFSLATSSSYALDNKAKETVLAKVLLEYDNGYKERLTPEKRIELPSSIDYNFIVGEQSILHKEGREGGTVVHGEGFYVPFRSYITTHKIHQPLVYKNSVVSSYEKISTPYKSSALDLEFSSILSGVTQGGVIQVGTAFLTNLVLHEFGHVVVADYVGASGTKLNFLKKQDGNFFLGTTIVKKIDDKSRLPLSMGGGMASDLTFEHALQSYRKNPTLYNKSLLFFSAIDFLWYSTYAFYLSNGHPYFDPIAISKETGISKDMLFSIILAKTMINAYRVYSGRDRVIPYFTVDKNSAILNISITF